MSNPIPTPSFPSLLQRFFIEHLGQQRAVSPRTIAAYRDTFRLLLGFAEATIGKTPAVFALADLDAKLILGFLDHLEKIRNNTVRSRNARLAALRSFLKFAAHHDLTALAVIEQALAVPMKKFDRPMLGFLTRPEMQALLNAPDPMSWAGRRDRPSSACFTIPVPGCRRPSGYVSAMSSPRPHRRPTFEARDAKNAAYPSGVRPPH
jgi:integrase/recombinase XerD